MKSDILTYEKNRSNQTEIMQRGNPLNCENFLLLLLSLAYTIDAPHSSHGATLTSDFCMTGGVTGAGTVTTGLGGNVTTFLASTFGSAGSEFPFLLDSPADGNWLGVCERDSADAAPPTAWLAVQ